MRTAVALVAAAATGCGADGDTADVEAGEDLPGGATTNTLLFGANAFITPAANITDEHALLFHGGNSFFNQAWVEAPASTVARDGLGPLFNARSCAACHFKDGRGRPPLEPGEPFVGLLLRISVDGQGPHGEPIAEPTYGGQIQPFAIPGVAVEATPHLDDRERPGTFADGAPFALLAPTYRLEDLAHGPLAPGARLSPRVAPAVIGLGLLEAIPEDRLIALSDPEDRDGDGVSGRPNRVWDTRAGRTAIGRFGWKADQPTVRQQSAAAFAGDIGITSSLNAADDCTPGQTDCTGALDGGRPELPDDRLDRVERYAQLLAVPARHGVADRQVLRGKRLFHKMGCAACHVPSHETGAVPDLPELSGQLIWPYTDLLLHDLGEDLTDDRPVFAAAGREWRTPPLWGLRFYRTVNGHDRLLHDGRARGVTEAILWHGGEAERARELFRASPVSDRLAIVSFVESL